MKQIAIYCVNYKSYRPLHRFLDSIAAAVARVNRTDSNSEQAAIHVFLADNTEEHTEEISYRPSNFTLQIFPFHKNLGYFGAVGKMMSQESPDRYDFAIISNVDVSVSEDAIVQMLIAHTETDTGWIAPCIYSRKEGRDRNPKIMARYSKQKLKVLRFFFRHPWIYNLYTHSAYKSKKLISHSAGKVYAGHGSFIILTKEFFARCGSINYPIFLFCEEIYLAEQCIRHQLTVEYMPDIKVYDEEHASTGTFKRRRYCQFNYDAIDYILRTYYAEDVRE